MKDMGHRLPATDAEYETLKQTLVRERTLEQTVSSVGRQGSSGAHVAYQTDSSDSLQEMPLYLCMGCPTSNGEEDCRLASAYIGTTGEANNTVTVYELDGIEDPDE